MHSTSLPNLHTQPCSDHPKATRDTPSTPPTVREFKGRSRFHSLSLLANRLSSRGSPFHSSNPDGRCVCVRARATIWLYVSTDAIISIRQRHRIQTTCKHLRTHFRWQKLCTQNTLPPTRLPTQEYHLRLDDHVEVVRVEGEREWKCLWMRDQRLRKQMTTVCRAKSMRIFTIWYTGPRRRRWESVGWAWSSLGVWP